MKYELECLVCGYSKSFKTKRARDRAYELHCKKHIKAKEGINEKR